MMRAAGTTTIPTLETDRLILREFRSSDIDGFLRIYTDPHHARFISRVPDRAAAFEKMSSLIGHWHLRGWGRFAVEEKASGAFVGHCGASQPDEGREAELNYSFTANASGQGLASEAVRKTLSYLYRIHGWKTAISEINPANERSRKLAQRLGATREGVRDAGFATLEIWRYPAPEDFFKSNPSCH